ncbi:NAD(P)/FAD-dependent oxidoreductase [Phycicoccus endophyticus]|uniref:NAD(P)/FAD-dependent oxidoreductase n=1 Tax=Phycicoccus endophyticus TaxID=1690220 RepID=A0A7G9R5C6_9MICO|nr:NAD(P)/FAD-dependent oxidoreductase [Phycicoccus endophyticus]NHI20969.1 NAD(P)/FAD-dependent oxidoreductase [Phycicoccus endophyticus]QNN50801.1 NAD(P)/FAD-dependent oxidoreductase [Phycicoccus endophyticus]GGL40402.1 pyridine nucleotide-disulfide oxidoreductase [Phycicoccus endophyticus]
MSEEHVDLVVLGLGPGGESVATQAARAGMTVVGVDERLVGGECPYYGCIPSKMMVRAAGSLAEAHRVAQLAGSATVAPDLTPVARRIREEATSDWDDTVAVQRLEDAGVTFVRGHGRLAGPGVVEVGDRRFVAGTGVVLNTGTAPAAPPVDGLADTPYWTNREALRATEAPAALVVVGGGAIGAELAQAFARFGTRVSVLEAAPRLLALEEPEASAVVADSFARDGVQVLSGARIRSVTHAEGRFAVAVTDAEGTGLDLSADRLLVAAGRRPNLADIGLDTVGLDPTARSIDTDERMRAGEKLWAVGDITGRGAFTHMSMYQAGIAVRDLTGADGPWASYHAVPRVTYTDPEVGAVGMTEQQARDASLAVRTGLVTALGTRGWIHGPGGEGLVKVVEDTAAGHLVGATAAGPSGGEVLAMLATAVHARVPTAVLREQVLAYPTFHRAVSSALDDLDG